MHANPLFACTKRRVFLFGIRGTPGEKKVIFSGVRDGGADRALNKIVNPKANRILTCGAVINWGQAAWEETPIS